MQTENFSLFHLIREPKTPSEKAPLAIMLHGYGSNEQDLFSFANELPDPLFVISVRAPFPMPASGNAWYAIHWDNANGKFSDDVQAFNKFEFVDSFFK